MSAAALPIELWRIVLSGLSQFDRARVERTARDLLEASRSCGAVLRCVEIGGRHAVAISDVALRRLLQEAVDGGGLQHVAVNGAGPGLTSAAFAPLMRCKTLMSIDLRGSTCLLQDSGLYAVIDSLLPYIPDGESSEQPLTDLEDMNLAEFRKALGEPHEPMEGSDLERLIAEWAKAQDTIETDSDGKIISDIDKAERLYNEHGAEECHRRLEMLRAGRGEGHASYNFRHFLRDHTGDYRFDDEEYLADLDGADYERQIALDATYGCNLAYRMNNAEYWRSRVKSELCGRCGETLTMPSESWSAYDVTPDMDGDDFSPENGDDWRGYVTTCLHCSRTLCFWCSKKCDESNCTAARCNSEGSYKWPGGRGDDKYNEEVYKEFTRCEEQIKFATCAYRGRDCYADELEFCVGGLVGGCGKHDFRGAWDEDRCGPRRAENDRTCGQCSAKKKCFTCAVKIEYNDWGCGCDDPNC